MESSWDLPPELDTTDGKPRSVGIEIELQGIEIGSLAALTAEALDGKVERVSSVEYEVAVPDLGNFRVEVDFALLKKLARESEEREDIESESARELAVELLDGASALLVPCEIVTAPLPMRAMAGPMDALVRKLHAAGAKGTRQSVFYAFGVHLNVDPPNLDASTVVAYLQAFVCLYDWIVDEGQVDLSRQISPYIRPYNRDYALLLADPRYRPDWTGLIDDYLAHNPTRDRALDMLPMLAHVDEDRVRAVVDDPLIKPRPAFHYRLANSCIDEDGWSIAQPWNRWNRIERLAADRDTLDEWLLAFAKDRGRLLSRLDRRWVQQVRQWLAT